MDKIIVIGSGGLAREFSAWFGDCYQISGFASSDTSEHAEYGLPGELYPEDISPESAGTDLAVLAVGTPASRQQLFEHYSASGFTFPVLVHHSSTLAATASLAQGVVVAPHCVIGPNVVIERGAFINFSCGVGHDAVIGEFSQINPGAQLGGNVTLGAHVLVGSGATVLQQVKVAAEATIASGAAVFSRVAAGTTVMGNPARRLRGFEA